MKMWKRLMTLALAVILSLGMTVGTALADEPLYDYSVTFYAGNQGTFVEEEQAAGLIIVELPEGTDPAERNISYEWYEDKIVVRGLHLGDKVGIDPQKAVQMNANSKYYVKGIRQSGRDNSTVADTIFVVDGDADYVVAYGIKGNQVSYTVKYQDGNGRQLAADQVYYGNVGDKPVVAYKYISGYAPKALGLTKTLSENAAENIFTFVYNSVPTPTINEIVNEVVVEVVVGGGARPAPSGGGTGTGTGTEDETEPEDESQSEPIDETQENPVDETQESVENPTQGEDESESESESGGIIVDLDDPEVPLAPGVDVDSNLLTYGAIGAAGLAALLATCYLLFMMKASKKKADQ